jgi:hypothetical protein
LADKGVVPEQRRQKAAAARQTLEASVERGDPVPFEIAGLVGPLSVNPRGIYEGRSYHFFPCRSPQTSMNSFNMGEFVFPNSYWSLSPLLLGSGAIIFLALRRAARWREANPQANPAQSRRRGGQRGSHNTTTAH